MTVALNAANRRRTPLEQSLRQARDGEPIRFGPRALQVIESLLASLDQHRQLSTERNAGELLYHFVTSSGWLGRLTREAREGGEERIANVARFFEIVRRQAGLLRDDRLPFLVAQLDTLMEAGDDPSTADVDLDHGDAVHVLTYHKAKGLEFPIVHMVGLVDDRFPTRSRGDLLPLPAALVREPMPEDDQHLAEERRLFYVGMTRAREALHLSWARDYGSRTARRPSPYLLEALDLPPATPVDLLRPSVAERLARQPARADAACRAGQARRPGRPPAAPQLRPDQRLPGLPGALSVRARHPPADRRLAPDGLRPCPARRRAGLSPPAAGRSGHVARRAQAELDAAWESVGFLTQQHEQARRAAAREALERFWNNSRWTQPARWPWSRSSRWLSGVTGCAGDTIGPSRSRWADGDHGLQVGRCT